MGNLKRKIFYKLRSYTAIRWLLDLPVHLITRIPVLSHLYFLLQKYIAITGTGTNQYIKNDVMLYPIHFYYPVPDFKRLKEKDAFKRQHRLDGIKFDPDEHLSFLHQISKHYGHECNFPSIRGDDETVFTTDNDGFGFDCAALLHCMIREFKPRRIIEVGAGNSSKVINKAVQINIQDGHEAEYYSIDPYPHDFLKKLPHMSKLIAQRVEDLDTKFFQQLGMNDILFIDSSHQVIFGNDVNYLILEILPILKPGVFVHFHDINLPYAYPEVYYFNEYFRTCWNEQYLLQAFLCMNPNYSIKLPAHYLHKHFPNEFRKAFQHLNPDIHTSTSGSFWIQRNLTREKS